MLVHFATITAQRDDRLRRLPALFAGVIDGTRRADRRPARPAGRRGARARRPPQHPSHPARGAPVRRALELAADDGWHSPPSIPTATSRSRGRARSDGGEPCLRAEAVAPVAPRRRVALTIGVLVALLAALLPLVRVVAPGWWLLGALLLAALVLAAGYVARRYRLPAVAVTPHRGSGLGRVHDAGVPARHRSALGDPDARRPSARVPRLLEAAVEEIALGAAPLERERWRCRSWSSAAIGLLAIIVDHVVLTARMPLLAAVGIVAVSLIPAIAVPSDVDVIVVRVPRRRRSSSSARRDAIPREAAEREAEHAPAACPATALGHRRDRGRRRRGRDAAASRRSSSGTGRGRRARASTRRCSSATICAAPGGRGAAGAHRRPHGALSARDDAVASSTGASGSPTACGTMPLETERASAQ